MYSLELVKAVKRIGYVGFHGHITIVVKPSTRMHIDGILPDGGGYNVLVRFFVVTFRLTAVKLSKFMNYAPLCARHRLERIALLRHFRLNT